MRCGQRLRLELTTDKDLLRVFLRDHELEGADGAASGRPERALAQASWEIPGGGMDLGEYPLQTAQREIKEELGIDVQLGSLLVVDWVPPQPDGRPRWSTSCSTAATSPRTGPANTSNSIPASSARGG